VQQTHKHHGAINLIEDAGSGTPLLQELRLLSVYAIPQRPWGDKATRFLAVTPRIEAGQVHLPARAAWLDAFKRELLSFPDGGHDDQVDAFSQLLGWALDPLRNVPLQTTYHFT